MTHRQLCPVCHTREALLLRSGVGGTLAICRMGCQRATILRALAQEDFNQALADTQCQLWPLNEVRAL
jgi:hypothetical protein